MALYPAAAPLCLVHDQSTTLGRPERRPLAYAYVLIDLTGTPTDEMAFLDACDGLSRRISDEVTWRLTLRTDGDGFLKDPYRLSRLPDEGSTEDAGYRRLLDAAPPFQVPLGLELNLWWCRERARYDAAFDGRERRRGEERIRPVTRERQLQKVSTKLRRALDVELAVAIAARVPGWTREQVVRSVAAGDDDARRTVTFGADAQGRVAGLRLELEDTALTWALFLADQLDELSRFAPGYQVTLVQAYMDRLERVLARYERGDRSWTDELNTILESARARRSEYQHIGANLRQVPRQLAEHIRDAGALLERLADQAFDEARWHLPRRRAAESIAFVSNRLGTACAPELMHALTSTEATLAQEIARVRRGERADGRAPLLRVLTGAKDAAELSAGLFDIGTTASEWLELTLSQAIGRDAQAIERLVDRAGQVLALITPGGDAWEPGMVVRGDPYSVLVTLDEGAQLSRTDVQRWVTGAPARGVAFFERLNRVLAFVNVGFALYDVYDDPSFRNWAALGQSAADLATKIERVQAAVCSRLGITTQAFGAIVGVWGAAISFADAAEAGLQGNRVAMVGHMLGGAGGVCTVLATRGSGLGVVAALLIVGGATLVVISLSDDAAWVLQNFDDITDGSHSQSQTADAIERRADRLMTLVRGATRDGTTEAQRLSL